MRLFVLLIAVSLLFSACRSLRSGSDPTQFPIRQPLATSTEISEELIVATEQSRADAVQTEFALTMASQSTFTSWPTFTPTSAHLPTFTPIANSTPAMAGAYFVVASNVLGPKYEIENACYFDTQSGWERYEIYAGAVSGSGDKYSAQGVIVVRVFRMTDRDGEPVVELAETKEYLTLSKEGPLRLPSDYGDSCYGDWMSLRTPLDFMWMLNPVNEEFFEDFHSPPLARMEIGEKTQVAERGSFCWKGGCADGPVISTSSIPLVAGSPVIAHLYLPLREPPDSLSLSAMFISPPGILQGDASYDYVGKDTASWSYEKPGRELLDLGLLPLRREQDVKLSLESGYYALTVLAVWHDYGDVKYGFLIEVSE